jgi:hypothetical protein
VEVKNGFADLLEELAVSTTYSSEHRVEAEIQASSVTSPVPRKVIAVARIVIGLDMTCTSNENFGTTDGFTDVKLNSKNRFKATFSPQKIDAAGTPAQIEGAITGRRSKDRRSIKGTWSYKVTFFDAAGTTVTDTCESGLVSWKAEQ